MAAGYSGKSLAAKLGIKPGQRVYVHRGPDDYAKLVDPLPEDVTILTRPARSLDLIHLFATEAEQLAEDLGRFRDKIKDNGMIWVSWPKKASKVSTDVTEDVVREHALPLGLVDVKVCAVDEIWSGLKLVIRVEHRSNP